MSDAGQDGAARVVWFELRTADLERSAAFCAELFGWTFRPFDGYRSDYWLVEGPSGGLGGALVAGGSAATLDGGTVYVEVADLVSSVERALALGGRVLIEPTAITADDGMFAVVADGGGMTVGLWAAR